MTTTTNITGTSDQESAPEPLLWTEEEVKELWRSAMCEVAERFYVAVHGSLLKDARKDLDNWYLTSFQQFKSGKTYPCGDDRLAGNCLDVMLRS